MEERTQQMNTELVFEVTEADGGNCAERLTENNVTQADTWEELCANVKDAVAAYFLMGGIQNGCGCA